VVDCRRKAIAIEVSLVFATLSGIIYEMIVNIFSQGASPGSRKIHIISLEL